MASFPRFNETCFVCQQSATVICACSHQTTYLCADCIPSHCRKFPNLAHQILPVHAKNSDFQEYRRQSGVFMQRKEELAATAAVVTECCDAYSAAVDTFISALSKKRTEDVAALLQWKAELEAELAAAVESAEAGLGADRCQLTSRLHYYLLSDSPVSLFSYSVSTERLFEHINSVLTVRRQWEKPVCSSPLAPALPCIDSHHITFCDFELRKWNPKTSLSQQIQCDEGSSYTMIANHQVLICGCN